MHTFFGGVPGRKIVMSHSDVTMSTDVMGKSNGHIVDLHSFPLSYSFLGVSDGEDSWRLSQHASWEVTWQLRLLLSYPCLRPDRILGNFVSFVLDKWAITYSPLCCWRLRKFGNFWSLETLKDWIGKFGNFENLESFFPNKWQDDILFTSVLFETL